MKIELDVSKESIEHLIDYMEQNTDECYIPGIPYPPSSEWVEFLEALKHAIVKSDGL